MPRNIPAGYFLKNLPSHNSWAETFKKARTCSFGANPDLKCVHASWAMTHICSSFLVFVNSSIGATLNIMDAKEGTPPRSIAHRCWTSPIHNLQSVGSSCRPLTRLSTRFLRMLACTVSPSCPSITSDTQVFTRSSKKLNFS